MLAILCPIYHCINCIKKLLIIVRAGNVSWTALVVLNLILSWLTIAVAFQFKNIKSHSHLTTLVEENVYVCTI